MLYRTSGQDGQLPLRHSPRFSRGSSYLIVNYFIIAQVLLWLRLSVTNLIGAHTTRFERTLVRVYEIFMLKTLHLLLIVVL